MATTDQQATRLIAAAREAATRAYVPYSHFPVGAAIIAADGTLYKGCNIENAAYGLANCAERTALFKAVSEGAVKFDGLAIYGETLDPISPCGACRQALAEFCRDDMPIYLTAKDGTLKATTLGALLPYAFRNLD